MIDREEIVNMAREAGLIFNEDCGAEKAIEIHRSRVERFADLVSAATEERWKQAVIDELVCCHIYSESHKDDPRKVLQDIIKWHSDVALDPAVSGEAKALIDRGAAAEREACANIDVTPLNILASDGPGTAILKYRAAIRARGEMQ